MSDPLNETVLAAQGEQSTDVPPATPQPAQQLPEQFGRYRVQKLLGRGGMGSVWLATDTQLQRPVALKVPAFARDCPREMLQRFYREAQSAATLSHPNICPVYDVGQHDGIHYITMGFIDGRPLTDYIKSDKEQGERSIALLIRKLALALHEAHAKGIIHRDLKPANVMINQRNEPIVMDFGLARQIADDQEVRMTREGIAMGSPGYMSPEQVQGRTDLGPATDIYSLGVVLYELLTGEPPFSGNLLSVLHQITQTEPKPVQELRPNLSPGMAAICRKAMAKKPEERYRSMRELAEAVTAFVKGEGATTPDAPLVPGPRAEPAVTAAYPAVNPPAVRTRKIPAQTVPVAAAALPALPAKRRKKRKQDNGANLKVFAGIAGGAALVLGGLLVLQMNRGTSTDDKIAGTSPAVQPADTQPKAEPAVQPAPAVVEPAPVVAPASNVAATANDVPVQAPVAAPPGIPAPQGDAMAGRGGPGPFEQPQGPGPGQGQGFGPGPGFGRGPQRGFNPQGIEGNPDGDPENRPLGGGPNFAVNLAFEQYDRDQNGLLDPQEIPFHIVLRADANNDQLVSAEELKAAKARMAEKLFAEPSEQERGNMNRGPMNERGRRGQLRRGPGQRNPQQPPRGG